MKFLWIMGLRHITKNRELTETGTVTERRLMILMAFSSIIKKDLKSTKSDNNLSLEADPPSLYLMHFS